MVIITKQWSLHRKVINNTSARFNKAHNARFMSHTFDIPVDDELEKTWYR